MVRPCLATSLSTLLLLAPAAICQGTTPADLQQVRKAADAAVQAGEFETAAAGFRKLTEANPKDAQAWHMLGYSLHAGGKLDEALPIHLKAAGFKATAAPASYNVACVHAMQGHTDEAFAWLDKAIARGFRDADLLANDTDLASLRKDARFAALTDKLAKHRAAAPKGTQALTQVTERKATRMLWFDDNGIPGEIAISYAPVPWNERYDVALAGGKFQGQRWRLGADFWTTLDTSVPMQFGAVAVAPGYYYLTVVQRAENDFVLALHDAAAVRKQRIDAAFAQQLQGGIEVPLVHAATDEIATELSIALSADDGSATHGTLAIRFGSHQLSAATEMKLE